MKQKLRSLAVSRSDGTFNAQSTAAGERDLYESHDAGQSSRRADRGIFPAS